jgi:hypothetical protein
VTSPQKGKNWTISAMLSSVKFGKNCNFEVKSLLSVKLLKFIGGSCEFYSGYVEVRMKRAEQ